MEIIQQSCSFGLSGGSVGFSRTAAENQLYMDIKLDGYDRLRSLLTFGNGEDPLPAIEHFFDEMTTKIAHSLFENTKAIEEEDPHLFRLLCLRSE